MIAHPAGRQSVEVNCGLAGMLYVYLITSDNNTTHSQLKQYL